MKIGAAFPGEYWRQEDGGWPRKFTIEKFIEQNKVGDDIKPAIYFVGEERGLILNKTTSNQITNICGSDETDDWIAREIVVYVDPDVMFGSKKTGGLRVRAPKQQAVKPAVKPASKPTTVDEDMNDEVPW